MKLINDTPWWAFALIALVCFFGSSLLSEIRMQRTPEHVAVIAKQEALESQAKESLRKQEKARNDELRAKSWSEVGFSEVALHKFIAHGYPFWLFCGILMLSGPFLMRKFLGH